MKRLNRSGKEKSIEEIWDWYEYHLRLSVLSKVGLQKKVITGDPDVDPRFFGMSLDELDEFFAELDFLAMLDLLSATEAAVRLEYWARVDEKRKDRLSKALREVYRQTELKAKLDEDLLDTWVEEKPAAKRAIGDFKGALNLRHWLAHGRYWAQNFGRDYSPGDVFDICHALINAVRP